MLPDLTFEVAGGAFVGLIGPNGSGKTTLLRTMAGLLPYEGSIRVANQEVRLWNRRALARKLAFVRQFQALPFDFTVEELVLLGRTPHKRWLQEYDAADRRQAHHALAELEVEAYRTRSVQELSGGELQRVLLAQALVQDTDILLLDEPTAHLDVHHQFSFLSAVRRQTSDRRTVFAVFHDLELAARYADHLVVLSHGRCASTGPPSAVLTPHLLKNVFRMEADVDTDDAGAVRIRYLGPSSGAPASKAISVSG